MTVQEKRTELKNYADTLDPEMIDRVYNFVIRIKDNNKKTAGEENNDTIVYRDATEEEVKKVLDYIDRNYGEAMERLAQWLPS